jgi:hypothetical protein
MGIMNLSREHSRAFAVHAMTVYLDGGVSVAGVLELVRSGPKTVGLWSKSL